MAAAAPLPPPPLPADAVGATPAAAGWPPRDTAAVHEHIRSARDRAVYPAAVVASRVAAAEVVASLLAAAGAVVGGCAATTIDGGPADAAGDGRRGGGGDDTSRPWATAYAYEQLCGSSEASSSHSTFAAWLTSAAASDAAGAATLPVAAAAATPVAAAATPAAATPSRPTRRSSLAVATVPWEDGTRGTSRARQSAPPRAAAAPGWTASAAAACGRAGG